MNLSTNFQDHPVLSALLPLRDCMQGQFLGIVVSDHRRGLMVMVKPLAVERFETIRIPTVKQSNHVKTIATYFYNSVTYYQQPSMSDIFTIMLLILKANMDGMGMYIWVRPWARRPPPPWYGPKTCVLQHSA